MSSYQSCLAFSHEPPTPAVILCLFSTLHTCIRPWTSLFHCRKHYRVLIYNGDVDACVPYLGDEVSGVEWEDMVTTLWITRGRDKSALWYWLLWITASTMLVSFIVTFLVFSMCLCAMLLNFQIFCKVSYPLLHIYQILYVTDNVANYTAGRGCLLWLICAEVEN